jgi:hypothetical protein
MVFYVKQTLKNVLGRDGTKWEQVEVENMETYHHSLCHTYGKPSPIFLTKPKSSLKSLPNMKLRLLVPIQWDFYSVKTN